MKFLARASSPEGQAEMAELSGYASTNLKSPELMDPEVAKTLLDTHEDTQIDLDVAWWAANRDELAGRW